MTEIDYRALLLKYIAHVAVNEGVDFIDNEFYRDMYGRGVKFTDEEWRELRVLNEFRVAHRRQGAA